jgi:hypothetical protein
MSRATMCICVILMIAGAGSVAAQELPAPPDDGVWRFDFCHPDGADGRGFPSDRP